MPVTCPACGAASLDREFCDRCNASFDIEHAAVPPSYARIAGQVIEIGPADRQKLTRPESSVRVRAEGGTYRLHWIANKLWSAWEPLLRERQSFRAASLPDCQVVEEAAGQWIVAEAATPGLPGADALVPGGDPVREVRRLADVLDKFQDGLQALHAAGLVWLTFDPEEVETANGRLRFTNLDLRVYPAGRCPAELDFIPAFAAPEVCRFQDARIDPRTDVFHLALFGYYWLAKYLPHGFFGKTLKEFAFQVPPLRILAEWLPPGIASVLHRGLEVDPDRRFASVGEMCAAYREAVDRAKRRARSEGPLRWEFGLHSRPGRAKMAHAGSNEDYALLREFKSPERALVLLADGVSSCEVGSGAVASRLVCELTAERFGPESRVADFCRMLPAACRDGALALLQWALDREAKDRLLAGAGLMATTLTAAWLEGRELTLANVGDSRAYLIHDAGIEQLTVDGDLGTCLLAAGAPPEDVLALGGLGRALREYIGGCSRTAQGELTIEEDRCRPAVSHWPLLAGDVVVLCSDGLVEEGAFLEPGDLAELVRRHPTLSAAALAETLVEAAESRQRLPSEEEPEGFGDNITCAVIRIESLSQNEDGTLEF
jgi:serine/threonine protein phosphatase PrpC